METSKLLGTEFITMVIGPNGILDLQGYSQLRRLADFTIACYFHATVEVSVQYFKQTYVP